MCFCKTLLKSLCSSRIIVVPTDFIVTQKIFALSKKPVASEIGSLYSFNKFVTYRCTIKNRFNVGVAKRRRWERMMRPSLDIKKIKVILYRNKSLLQNTQII